MKIAITHPTSFARVRRGTERFTDELAFYLARRGHDVTVVACHPGDREVVRSRGFLTVSHRRLWHPLLAKAGIHEFHTFLITTLVSLLKEGFDVVHCCSFTDAYAASLARRVTGVPNVFWVNGQQQRPRSVRALSLGGRVFKRAILQSNAVVALSGFMQKYIEEGWGRASLKIPVPVDMEQFGLSRTRDHSRPIILCAAALNDPRKGARVLLKAFDRLKNTVPEAVLQVIYPLSDSLRNELSALLSPQWRGDLQILGDRGKDLPELFGRASVSVLPSLREPFGMVVIESMATGTPVVGTRDGALPELISNNKVGELFDPGANGTVEPTNVDGLAQALLKGIELSRHPETADRCRAHAEQFAWSVVGPRFEELYGKLLAEKNVSNKAYVKA